MTTFNMTNSSCAFKASSTCCIGSGRSPPSPDGDAPRLAPPTARPKPGKRLSKDQLPTWRAVETNETTELRAIFEEEIADGTGDILRIKHKGITVFREMLAINDDSSEKDSIEVKPRKSSNTLKTVTQRLKKHLSRESALSKRHSRSSVGTSEEEVERRAELRRIRERRIREELSNEGVCDDDAKSASSVAVAATSPRAKRSHFPWSSGNVLPLPFLTPPAIPLPKLSFPHLSPLPKRHDPFSDTSPTEGSTITRTPRRWSDPESSFNTPANSEIPLFRRYSSPYASEWETQSTQPPVYVPSRKRSSIPSMPPQPVIHPTRLPSIALPVRSSWRLSFSTGNRGDNLRKLSQGIAIPITLDPSQLRSKSPPLGEGIHHHDLRLLSQALLSSDETVNLESGVSHSQICTTSEDFGGVDGVGDGSAMIHLHEMGISQRLSARGLQSSCSSPQLSNLGSHQRGVSGRSGSSQVPIGLSHFMHNTEDSAPLSERIPQSWGQVVHGEASSSAYPSGVNSLQPSRESSRFNLLSLLPGARNKTGAAEYQELVSSQINLSLLRTPTANLSTTSLTIPLTRYPHHSNPDDSSLIASETSSFREREVELTAVQTRFAAAEARRVQTTPVSSKFREEFSSETEEDPVPQQRRRSSAFSKFAKFAYRTYDGAKLEELLDIPVPKFDPNQLKTPGAHSTPTGGGLLSPFGPPGTAGHLSPLANDEAINAWGKALKKTGDERAHEVGDHLQLPRKRSANTARKKSTIDDELPRSVFGNFTQIGKTKKKQAPVGHGKSAAEEYNERFQERLAVKEQVLDSWEEEMAASAERAKARSRNMVKKTKPTGPDRRYPASWSRFPSHKRGERSTSAGPSNKIDIKDFAVLGHEEGGEIIWCLEHDDEGHHSVIDDPNAGKGFRDKVKDRVRHKAYKFDTADRQSSHTSGRRGSLTIANELEYPELEILPVTLMTEAEMNAYHAEEEREAERKKAIEAAAGPRGPRARGPSIKVGSVDRNSEEDEENSLVQIPRTQHSVVSNTPMTFQDYIARFPETGHITHHPETPTKTEKKNKFRTWSGREFDGYRYGRDSGKRMSIGSMVMRKSTDDHLSEVERMEKAEREKFLKVAEELCSDEE
ncbi:uncharacterized protein PAC_09475 [Phialocephala subalpina]|uniref:Uncharacterized protein n=1 Tax=Phialocephala subalpina TaxID=576137 RepID=A0A1L7X3I4_9HELO|nr:uncharacterized protein PAC_09475 [Phialocephala subalpina]